MPQDIGLTPPPAPGVMSQMQGGAETPSSQRPVGDLLAAMRGAMPAQPPPADIQPEVATIEPLMQDLAQQVPTMAADIGNLMTRIKSRMGPAAPMGQPTAGPVPPPAPMPQTGGTSGAMDLAMQIEMVLPKIAAKDATLGPDVQYFVAKMRQEVPKAVQGGNANVPSAAPTDEMLKRLPIPS